MINAMFQGPRRLFNNTFFPVAYVAIGSKIEDIIPEIFWEKIKKIEFSTDLKKIEETYKSLKGIVTNIIDPVAANTMDQFAEGATNSTTSVSANATAALTKSDFLLTAQESFSSGWSTLGNHSLEIGTAAAIGATATIVNAILARTPGIKYWPKTRLVTAIALSTAGVLAGAKLGLEQDIDPQTILNITAKVGIIGTGMKLAVVTTRMSTRVIRGSTDIISWGIRKSCNGIIFATERLDWGSWPKGPVAPHVGKRPKKYTQGPDTSAVVNERSSLFGLWKRTNSSAASSAPANPSSAAPATTTDLHSEDEDPMRSDDDS